MIGPGDLVVVVNNPLHSGVEWTHVRPGLIGVVISGLYDVGISNNTWASAHDVRFPNFTATVALPLLQKIDRPPEEEEILAEVACGITI